MDILSQAKGSSNLIEAHHSSLFIIVAACRERAFPPVFAAHCAA